MQRERRVALVTRCEIEREGPRLAEVVHCGVPQHGDEGILEEREQRRRDLPLVELGAGVVEALEDDAHHFGRFEAVVPIDGDGSVRDVQFGAQR